MSSIDVKPSEREAGDVVKRLRAMRLYSKPSAIDEAADLIERQQQEIERLREELKYFGELAKQDHDQQQQEIERLKEELATTFQDPYRD